VTASLSVAGLAACAALSPQADQTKYFVLAPRAAPDETPRPFGSTLGIGPVHVPDHLDESVVTRLADEEIDISDTERWGEPLRDSLPSVLRQNLASLLGAERILVYPWRPSAPPDLAVALELTRFERTTRGTIEVAARWSVQRGSATTPLINDSCSIRRSFQGRDTRAAVAALSLAVAEMSRRIAADVALVSAAPHAEPAPAAER
jgi:uncharacterized lipoprotein YmbA